MVEEFKGSAATKFRDGIFEIREVFLGAVCGDHRDEDDFELNVRVVFVLFDDEYTCCFSNDCSSAGYVGRDAWICWRCVGGCWVAEGLEDGVFED